MCIYSSVGIDLNSCNVTNYCTMILTGSQMYERGPHPMCTSTVVNFMSQKCQQSCSCLLSMLIKYHEHCRLFANLNSRNIRGLN